MPPIAQILHGDWHETAHGPVFVRDEWFPLDHHHGALPLGSALDAAPEALRLLLGTDAAPHPSRLAFFDIETTGLSGGTGTYVVLAGLGTYEASEPGDPPAFRMRQYFLADLAHEQAMLAMLAADTRPLRRPRHLQRALVRCPVRRDAPDARARALALLADWRTSTCSTRSGASTSTACPAAASPRPSAAC